MIAPRRLPAALAVLALALPAGATPPAEADFLLECQGCHMDDGSGVPGAVPALQGRVARFLLAPGGREYLVQVPGVAQAPLDDARLAALLEWMLQRFGPAAALVGHQPYSAAEVARLRKRVLVDVAAERQRLIEAIGSAESAAARAGSLR